MMHAARPDSRPPRHARFATLRAYYQRWLDRRLPPAQQWQLRHQQLFILPTRLGLLYLALVLALFLLGTNYQNNLILALAFLLASLFVTVLGHCYRNLAGLRLTLLPPEPGFVGEASRLALRLKSERPRYALQIRCADATGEELASSTESATLGVLFQPTRRGWLTPGRLHLGSDYPLGLLHCWSSLAIDHRWLIYPRPLAWTPTLHPGPGEPAASDGASRAAEPTAAAGRQTQHSAASELAGLQPYRPGESLSRIAWKQVAQGRGWHSKAFAGQPQQGLWLRLQMTPGQQTEERLGYLTHAVLQLEQRGITYGLALGRNQLAPGQGAAHKEQALMRLALYVG